MCRKSMTIFLDIYIYSCMKEEEKLGTFRNYFDEGSIS